MKLREEGLQLIALVTERLDLVHWSTSVLTIQQSGDLLSLAYKPFSFRKVGVSDGVMLLVEYNVACMDGVWWSLTKSRSSSAGSKGVN